MALATAPRHSAIYRTSALGTRVELLVTDPGCLIAATEILQQELERIDLLASRFRADSEISRLQRAGGTTTQASDGLIEALLVAVRVAMVTDGAVDPTVGEAMCRLGYDRDFSLVKDGRAGELPPACAVPGWRSIEVNLKRRSIRLPPGTKLDLGATAKALASDRIASAVHRTCGCGVLVSLGGDIAVAGAPAGGFRIGLGEDCETTSGDAAVAVSAGGLATSGIAVRRWRLGETLVHHIVDPSSGHPVAPVWRTVSVCAASCVDANAASTAAMVKGAAALAWLAAMRLPARLVAPDGTVHTVGGWPVDGGGGTAGARAGTGCA